MLLKDNHKRLISYLEQESTPVNANHLSSYLGVSTRTIRTYIHDINSSNLYQITSSMDGYSLHHVKNTDITSIPSTPQQRINYIVQKLLHYITIDYFELADTLYVSIPTIEKDILLIKSDFKNYNLSLNKRGTVISIQGKEEDIRNMMTILLKKEVITNYFGINYIQSIYKDIEIDKIKEIILTNLKISDYHINGYLLDNLILHITIAIDRIRKANTLDTTIKVVSKMYDKKTHDIAKNISNDLETHFAIILSDNEIAYIALLLTTKISAVKILDNKNVSLYHYIDPKYTDSVKLIMKKINDYYGINISSNEFHINFALHVQNLAIRSKYHKKIANPLIYDLKRHHPFIYNLSVFVSNNLKQLLEIDINEDEIAFISIHLGSYIERINEIENKVTCVIISPEYYFMKTELVEEIRHKFDNQIEIVSIYSNIDEFINDNNNSVDLIISSYPIQSPNTNIELLIVPPFFSKRTHKLITKKIQEIEKMKIKNKMDIVLTKYLDCSFFEKNIYLTDEYAYIEYMGNKLASSNIIKKKNINLIHEREKLSSTAFNSYVAMPHALEMIARKTTISIIINENPIRWGNSTVKIIAMVVMNKKEQKEFRIVFDFITEILSNKNAVNILTKSNSYQEFINHIVTLI